MEPRSFKTLKHDSPSDKSWAGSCIQAPGGHFTSKLVSTDSALLVGSYTTLAIARTLRNVHLDLRSTEAKCLLGAFDRCWAIISLPVVGVRVV